MNTRPAICVQNLRKIYVVPIREAGVRAAMKSLIQRQKREIAAVDRVMFDVQLGEIVGFLGPNGAGKTTTLKMLSGLLHPTDGTVSVLGFQPWQRRKEFLRQITLVMGNRNQLVWDIPCIDSFQLNRVIYGISQQDFKRTLDELVELLDLEELLTKPVRNLSLGERMKCEIAGSLLHRPRVLFLDEPTIGLDVTMQRRIRSFIAEYNRRHEATIMLTSHYMADVEALCQRIVMIHHGEILFDGALTELVRRFSPHKTISLELQNDIQKQNGSMQLPQNFSGHLSQFGQIIEQRDGLIRLRVSKSETANVTGYLLSEYPITDLTVEDPPIEEVIEQAFAESRILAAR
ncbi:ATP-binding cassette domain-containing protein [Chloroflexi bacterium TSY]|nr:ATP-binding cassette domain-containing protein [Chloroflexi bacterium TSY]